MSKRTQIKVTKLIEMIFANDVGSRLVGMIVIWFVMVTNQMVFVINDTFITKALHFYAFTFVRLIVFRYCSIEQIFY